MKIEKQKTDTRTARDLLIDLGFVYEGIETNRRGKRFKIYQKYGVRYFFRGQDIRGEVDIINLEEYNR